MSAARHEVIPVLATEERRHYDRAVRLTKNRNLAAVCHRTGQHSNVPRTPLIEGLSSFRGTKTYGRIGRRGQAVDRRNPRECGSPPYRTGLPPEQNLNRVAFPEHHRPLFYLLAN